MYEINAKTNENNHLIPCYGDIYVIITWTMGSGSSSTRNDSSNTSPETIKTQHHVRQASIRAKQPMPDPNELERRFTKVLVSNKTPRDDERKKQKSNSKVSLQKIIYKFFNHNKSLDPAFNFLDRSFLPDLII